MRHIMRGCLLLLLTVITLQVQSQQQSVTVPDVTGLNIPQAAAALNQNGLVPGTQTAADGTQDAPPNTVISQATAPGTTVPYGTAVDLSVVLPPNTRLVYDDNDVTLVNITGEPLTTSGLVFNAIEGTTARYPATTFWGSRLAGNRCFQLWSISRNEPKSLDACDFIDGWRTTNNSQYYFWTQANGVNRFAVEENGVQRATCPAAPPNSQNSPTTCEFYLEGGGQGSSNTDFVYFAYTEEAIAFINTSDDAWMPTDANTLYNYNPAISTPGASLRFGDPNLLRDEFREGLGDITRLAPGQCIMYILGDAPVTAPPEDCSVIAQRSLVPDVAFWVANFEVESITDGERRICPAPTPGRLTRCILLR